MTLDAQAIPIATAARAELRVPGYADFLALDRDAAWVTNEGRIERLVAASALPVASVEIPQPCGGMAVGFGSVWVADCQTRAVIRVSLESPRIEARIATGLADPTGELSLAVGAGSVWVLSDSSGILSRIDPVTNTVSATIRVQPQAYAVAFGYGAVWVTVTRDAGSVQRIDPQTNRVSATIATGPTPRFLAVGEGSVWTLNQGDGSITRIDPATNRVMATIPSASAGGGGDIATGGGYVWVRATTTLLSVIDPQTNQVIRTYGPPAGSGAVRATATDVWVTAHDVGLVWVLPIDRPRQ